MGKLNSNRQSVAVCRRHITFCPECAATHTDTNKGRVRNTSCNDPTCGAGAPSPDSLTRAEPGRDQDPGEEKSGYSRHT